MEFGCILNDTEAIQDITITNASCLEVRYSWSFLRHPPVHRADPLHDDEGVDMQSECDSLEGSSTSLQPAQGQEEASDGSRGEGQEERGVAAFISAAGVTVELTTPSPLGRVHYPKQEAKEEDEAKGEDTEKEDEEETAASSKICIDEVESGLPAEEENEEEFKAERQQPPKLITPSHSQERSPQERKRQKKKKTDPWQTVDDPFVPINIEQVSETQLHA